MRQDGIMVINTGQHLWRNETVTLKNWKIKFVLSPVFSIALCVHEVVQDYYFNKIK